jgi:hypothetical protein
MRFTVQHRTHRAHRHRRRTVASAALASLVISLAFGSPAFAGIKPLPPPTPPPAGPGGSQTDNGGQATAVDVVLSGNGLKGPPGRRHASVPATCWWRAAFGPSTDAKAMQAAYAAGQLQAMTRDSYLGANWASFYTKRSYIAATAQEFADAAAKPAGSVAWYMAVCRDTATTTDYMNFLGFSPIGIRYIAFPTGRPPAAHVAPRDLAVYAQDQFDLPTPTMDRNPKIIKARGASLVGLPTWFWVTNPAATGAPTGTRSVRAAAGNVWAQVDATSTGLTITSDAGRASCTPRQAATPYAPGTSETSACTLVFTKASVAHPHGWPVTISANWHLTWTGSGNTGADLGIQPHTWTTTVPVAEVQTIVTSGR